MTAVNRRGGVRSITARLTWSHVIVSAIALLLAGAALGAYDRATFRSAAVRNLSIQAQIVGANSVSALLFNDQAAADTTLSALSASPNVISAAIKTPDAKDFARYVRDRTTRVFEPLALDPGVAETYRFGDDEIVLVRRIDFGGKAIGLVSIRSDVQELNARRVRYLGIIAAVLMVSLVAAFVLSWLAQRTISTPIVHLAGVARRVSTDRDYSVRAADAGGTEEVVVLTTAFNDMLAQIQQRDQSLQKAQDVLEARVVERTAELDAANKELEAFSYSVSHDLRAPLRHVTGFASLLEMHAAGSLDDQGRKHLATIIDAAKRMGRLIDDLLAFSRMARAQLATQRVNLNQIVREARQEIGEDPNRHIEWRVAELPEAEGDAAMLRLVMTNLLSNAVKYSGPRDAVRIEVGSSRGAHGETVVFVRDNGVGFDMQYAHKLFGVFQRLHRSDEFEGTGIGLANVRRIIHRHGGRVWAEGALDQGATFFFSLPGKADTV